MIPKDSRGLLPFLLLAAGCHHTGSADAGYAFPTPIHRVIVVIKENHTFDNYFTGFPGADTVTTAQLSDGTQIQRPVANLDSGIDNVQLCHVHPCAVTAFGDGGMNGFDLIQGDPGQTLYSQFSPDTLPAYWTYAENFVLCDHYFTTMLGPSTPNHFATLVAQTPILDNPVCLANCEVGQGCFATADTIIPTFNQDTCTPTGNNPPCFDIPSVVDAFGDGLTWRGYGDQTISGPNTSFHLIKSLARDAGALAAHVRPSQQLLADLSAGDIPNFVHVDSVPLAYQEGALCPGENYTVQLVNAVMQSPYWNETAIIITWDDWGGWYDHVTPAAEFCPNGQFYNPGFRVPALIISPYAKKGYVLHTVTEHSSIPKLVEELFGLPMMHDRDPHARDAKVGSLMEAFDFTQAARPPLVLQQRTCP